MNVELLKRVKQAILAVPERMGMEDWAKASDTAPCGTVGCIYGWGKALETGLRGKELRDSITYSVQSLYADARYMPDDNPFDLTISQKMRLYFTSGWPMEYRQEIMNWEPQTPQYAQVVADRIDHFIATNGAE